MIRKEKFLDVFAPDKTNIILGAKGSGKTNFASVLMESFVAYGYEVWTNIHFFDYENVGIAINKHKLKRGVDYKKKPPEIHVVSSLYEMLCGLTKEGKKVVILDEAGIHASSSQSMSKGTTALKQLAYIIRHFDCCMILITQTSGSIPPDLREKLIDYRIKIYRQRRKAEFGERSVAQDEYGNDYINFPTVKTFSNIPHSVYPYDSHFPTGFEIDIDLKNALAALSKLKSSVEVEQHGREMLEELTSQAVKAKKQAKSQVRDSSGRFLPMDSPITKILK